MRRYGAFELTQPNEELLLLPHTPYEQPTYINRANGGIARHFDPLESKFTESALLKRLLRFLGRVFCELCSGPVTWNIKLHPYRVLARDVEPGNPTPEGIHRDGVEFIVTLMVKRHAIRGGETTVTDHKGNVLLVKTLEDPMDLVVADDAVTMHAVTPIEPVINGVEGFRDVLVIAYTREKTPETASAIALNALGERHK